MAIINFLLMFSLVTWHPYHVSTTEIYHNEKEKLVEISLKIFVNDFEKTLKKQCKCVVNITNPKNKREVEKLIDDYVKKQLQINIDGQLQEIKFVGYQQEDENTMCYFEITDVSAIKKIAITNTLLHDFDEDQINMMHVRIGGKEKTEKLAYPKKEFVLNL